MKYASMNIQGNIISSDVISKIAQDEERFQKPADFRLDRNTSVRNEIGDSWSAAKSLWTAFKVRRDKLKESETGTSLTRRGWMIPFFQLLGYELDTGKAEIINGKSYAISHRTVNRDGFPVHIVGVNQSLDRRVEHGTRLSPHALTQEYLNNHEHLYALTSNGRFLRVLRDATRLSRLSYLEFDLEQMMEEDLYAEFAILFRLLHFTRMPEKEDAGEESIIEYYHQEALSSGTRIRERLSLAVEVSIRRLADGLLQQSQNQRLQEAIRNEELKASDYYLYMLRTVYRMLFLLVIEDRNLIYPEKRDEDLNKKRKIYYDFYSIQRLTRLAERRVYVDPRKTDLWQSLLTTFSLFENGAYGKKLGINPLGSGLFSPTALDLVSQSELSNEVLLDVLRNLVLFENENKQITRVNYADLDVEEFGSVYEGLLEYDPVIDVQPTTLHFSFQSGDGRSSSGSHYTPEELVKPLIKHSLDYIIADKLKEGKEVSSNPIAQKEAQCKALLTITVCDVACGSGHILLSAARRIGMELAILRESIDSGSEVEQPSPPYIRQAIRDVIQHCIYGVDLNPLAVELCKVAFWLEAHNPGEPLNFLDHRIKNGNAIVGLAHMDELFNGIPNEAFKALPGDDKEVARELLNQNKKEQKNARQTQLAQELAEKNVQLLTSRLNEWASLPENSPDQIAAKERAYKSIVNSPEWWRLKALADVQVSQFFIPKEKASDCITTGRYLQYLVSQSAIQGQAAGMSLAKATEKRFFHWFLEFPEVFQPKALSDGTVVKSGGFDCILGNPPYKGGTYLSGIFGNAFINHVAHVYRPVPGRADLVTYFLRRLNDLLKPSRYLAIITTNTISQGDTRKGGLDILTQTGEINFVNPIIAWPGIANLMVSIFSFKKGQFYGDKFIKDKKVDFISPMFDSSEPEIFPKRLAQNLGSIFRGYTLLGDGFIISESQKEEFISTDEAAKKVLFPLINGQEMNSLWHQTPSRWAIYFREWDYKTAMRFGEVFDYVESIQKEYRAKQKRESNRLNWWRYGESRPALRSSLSSIDKCIAITKTSKYLILSMIPSDWIISDSLYVVTSDSMKVFGNLQSILHEIWARKYSTTLKTDLSYSSKDSFETFPMLELSKQSENAAKQFFELRKQLMENNHMGVTALYNEFHNPNGEAWVKDLQSAQINLDKSVLSDYGWHDLQLNYDFYEMDYLEGKNTTRFSISDLTRKELLERLLLLNHKRFEEEVAQGLHKGKDVEAYYEQKGKPIPEGTVFSDSKGSTKKKPATQARSTKQSVPKDSPDLFSTQAASSGPAKVGSQVTIKNSDGKVFCYHILKKSVKGEFTGSHKHISSESGLARAMLGKSVGDGFEFGTIEYSIIRVE